ncbi:MAG: Gfo/Idh/MocA family protein, partial [Planctomycetota bacterium]
MAKTRYAIVGVGLRSGMYVEAITETFADRCELVGLCDLNEGRLQRTAAIAAKAGADVPCFDAADFEAMIAQTKPDCVVIAVKDCDHDTYIVRAMELGCDVIIEKPLTTDETKCRAILDAQRRTGR